ncbi:METTL5 family protein [Candidatus Hikarchaeum yamanae]|uniref:METTL5 family protein n=1 Tax=Candidatus Hikarchaeum yamanae TaxID=2675326 RepID=UPI0039E9F66B|tara:strand:+ start:4644 stop:5276 length:633 start_codon:yes stop_codon:yes gene_type:complete
MVSGKKKLELNLSRVSDFENPNIKYEQYMTSAEVASTIIHVADMNGDIQGKSIVDLGTGTGMLAIGAALRNPRKVVGIEKDKDALSIAKRNEDLISPEVAVEWILADVKCVPIKMAGKDDVTGIMNPPFGAQKNHKYADRIFLEKISEISSISYSIHNCDSIDFIKTFVEGRGGVISHSYSATMELKKSQIFHTKMRKKIETEVHRIRWR